MYRLTRPSPEQLRDLIARQSLQPVYQAGGTIPDPPPAGFRINRGSACVGRGGADFAAAREAVRRWQMFPPEWVQLESLGAAAHAGQTVAVVARCLGLWTANCCRVVHVDERERGYAFTYATTDQHAIEGAERFAVEWREDDSVWFDIHAVFRPRDACVWLAYPPMRRLQRRFLEEAPARVARLVRADGSHVQSGAHSPG